MNQICYASLATSKSTQLLIDLRNILTEARDFNVQYGITGVLYYADGYFFQCMEGSEQNLANLLEKLQQDSRHHQIQLFESRQIESRSFAEWSMKFVGRTSQVQQYFLDSGFNSFNPTLLSQDQIQGLVACLSNSQACSVEAS